MMALWRYDGAERNVRRRRFYRRLRRGSQRGDIQYVRLMSRPTSDSHRGMFSSGEMMVLLAVPIYSCY